MASYGENPFPRPGDPNYEWFPEIKANGNGQWQNDSRGDRVPLEDQELTLEVVTNASVRGLFGEAQKSSGFSDPEITPEAVLSALLRAIEFHKQTKEGGVVPAKTLGWEVFGLDGPRNPNFSSVEEYLRGLCTIGRGIMSAGDDWYKALPLSPNDQQKIDQSSSTMSAKEVTRVAKMLGNSPRNKRNAERRRMNSKKSR